MRFALGLLLGAALTYVFTRPKPRRKPAVTVAFYFTTQEGVLMSLKIPAGKVGLFNVAFLDADGQPATVENPEALLSDASLGSATITPGEDSNGDGIVDFYLVKVSRSGAHGIATVTVQADALVGDETALISGSSEVEFVGGPAITVQLGDGQLVDA